MILADEFELLELFGVLRFLEKFLGFNQLSQ